MRPYEPLPRFFVAELPAEGTLGVLADDGVKAARARRIRADDLVELVDGRGGVVRAKVGDVGKKGLTYLALERRAMQKPTPPVALLQSVPKLDRAEWIIQKTTELGVDRIFFVQTDHSVAVKTSSVLPRWERIAIEALRQSGRAHLPALSLHADLDAALAALPPDARKILCNETEDRRPFVNAFPVPQSTPIVLAVGPEGGWSSKELQKFTKNGFDSRSLGENVLRVETAAIVSVAIATALCYNR